MFSYINIDNRIIEFYLGQVAIIYLYDRINILTKSTWKIVFLFKFLIVLWFVPLKLLFLTVCKTHRKPSRSFKVTFDYVSLSKYSY